MIAYYYEVYKYYGLLIPNTYIYTHTLKNKILCVTPLKNAFYSMIIYFK